MKKTIVAASLLLAMSANLFAQDNKEEGYVFTPVKELKVTSVKNQNRTGTCWCFSTLSFLESELIRMGKGEQDLSEMFVVSQCYKDKADKYVRLHGDLNFAQGGSFIDPLYVWKKYGIVPEEVMKGLNYGEDMHAHSEMESAAAAYLGAIIKNPNRKLPMDELMQVMENAINTGYSIAWASDVSEKGFTRNGIAIVPDVESMERSGSDQDHWLGLSKSEKDAEIQKMMNKPCPELKITQEMRQEAYDNYQTTDDHGMHIYGIAKDQTGKKYYMVKNSWGTDNKYKGTWYASEAFVQYKTMNIVVHKNALPKAIKAKLGIQ